MKRILSLAFLLCISGTAYTNEVEFRLEGAFLKPKSNVGAFIGDTPRSGDTIDQEMDTMEGLKVSIVKPWDENISFVGSIYTPMEGVMSPKVILSNAAFNQDDDPYGVAGKFTMLLAKFGGEYVLPLDGDFHPFVGGGLAFAYFYDGGTDTLLNHVAHAVEDFEIDNKLTWYVTAGTSYDIAENFSLTGSISYMHLKTDAAYQFSTYQGGGVTRDIARDELKLEMNPIIFTLGASWKF